MRRRLSCRAIRIRPTPRCSTAGVTAGSCDPDMRTNGLITRIFAAALATLCCASAAFAADDSYPSRQIRIIVGFAAGGAPDALARIVADRMTQSFKEGVI